MSRALSGPHAEDVGWGTGCQRVLLQLQCQPMKLRRVVAWPWNCSEARKNG